MKKILISFITFALVVLICRHIVADIKQEERICVLENMLANLSVAQNISSTDSVVCVNPQPVTVHYQSPSRKPEVFSPKEERQRPQRDTLKFTNPILIDLNLVDSATLVRVPGIGEKSASIIIRYREQLGGFYSPYQLREKLTWESAQDHMDEWCTQWFKADPRQIRKLNVNTADFKQILRHPYIEYEQTKALVRYRDKHKRVEGKEALRMLRVFSEEEISRLEYYLEF